MTDKHNIAVLGAGSWGTALSLALARNAHNVSLWAHSAEHVQAMQETGCNARYLPDFPFPANLMLESDLNKLVQNHSTFLIAVPSHAFRTILQKLKTFGITDNATIIWASKGFAQGVEEQAPVLLSEAVTQELGPTINQAIVSGPSFSKEVAADLPTAMSVAGNNDATIQFAAKLFHGQHMRIYTNPDFVGVQVGGAIKNVMAVAAGISDGLGFGANSRAAIITRGLAEIARLGCALGARADTFQGLAGMGDLVLTCTDDQSRNRRFGLGLGEGKTIETILREIGQEVESYSTTREVVKLARYNNIEMPICEQVYNVIYNNSSPSSAVTALLNRQLNNE